MEVNKIFRKMLSIIKSNYQPLITILFTAIIVSPFIIFYFTSHPEIIADVNVYSINLSKYFDILFHQTFFYSFGQSWFSYILVAPLFGLVYILELITKSNALAQLIVTAAAFTLSYYYLRKLLVFITNSRETSDGFDLLKMQANILALFYSTSLPLYMYLKDTLTMSLPYLLLPMLLYYALQYLKERKRSSLLIIFVVSIFLCSVNLTYLFLIFGYTTVLMFIMKYTRVLGKDIATKRIATVDLLLIFPILLSGITTYFNVLTVSASNYYESYQEHFYVLGSDIVNILKLSNTWGFNQASNGKLYYVFASFFQSGKVTAIAFSLLLTTILAVFFYSKSRTKPNKEGVFIITLSALMLILITFMFNRNNPLYSYLYETFTPFQVFRNTYKISPLYLLTAILIISYSSSKIKHLFQKILIFSFCSVLLLYNVPFWKYSNAILSERAIKNIPSYWDDSAKYLKDNSSPDSKILFVPAVYNRDRFVWRDPFQGNLNDYYLDNSYRLTNALGADPLMQEEMSKTFIRDDDYATGYKVDLDRLNTFLAKNGFDYVAITKDTKSYYQNPKDIGPSLVENGYVLEKTFQEIAIYKNSKNARATIVATGTEPSVQKVSNLRYVLKIPRIENNKNITIRLNKPFQKYWELKTGDKVFTPKKVDQDFMEWTIKSSEITSGEVVIVNYLSVYFRYFIALLWGGILVSFAFIMLPTRTKGKTFDKKL